MRIAAVGDVHAGLESAGRIRPHFESIGDDADILLLAGDLTRCGDPGEARVLARELEGLPVPVVAVLGNHDYHAGAPDGVRGELERVGVQVLEGESTVIAIGGATLGVAGTKGFGGGFAGACGSEFGEPEMKAFIRHTKGIAERLELLLQGLDTDRRVALLHYAPIEDTLRGERLEIYPFLGSYLLAEAIDCGGADLVLHGHAHAGSEQGTTPGGVRVRNVAQPLIRHAYNVFCLVSDEVALAQGAS